MSEYDSNGFETTLPITECVNFDENRAQGINCAGEVYTRYSRSGMTSTVRCDWCQQQHDEMLDGLAQRYPDSDCAPSWFDPTYAGERWNDDY